jgi:ATPase family protein associated with various cellular activities (AAA)
MSNGARTVTHATPFADLPVTPANHFKLYFYAGVSQVLAAAAERLAREEALHDRFPHLDVYIAELDECGVGDLASHEAAAWWRDAMARWEADAPDFLPTRAVRDSAGLDHDAMTLVFSAGLIEEDARFGSLFEVLNESHGQHHPTIGMLTECWAETSDRGEVRARIRRLHELGLLHVLNPEAPRLQQALEVPSPVWDAIRGGRQERPAPWARYRPPSSLTALDDLIVPESLRTALAQLPALLLSGDARAVIIRGPQHNGRRTVLGAIARGLGRGTLEIDDVMKPGDDRWRQAGVLATALNALPVAVCDLGPGETAEIPRAGGYNGPIGVAIGRSGGISGAATDRALTFVLDMPDVGARRDHWRRALDSRPISELDTISERFRMTSGNLRRAGRLAGSYAALGGRATITAGDVQLAARTLNRHALDTLAGHVAACGDWRQLAAREDTLRELMGLELRCRHRERLATSLSAATGLQSNCGVRALFRGPSGTGKTLAARLLAGVLQMDLYRLDLSSIINKYIGETEKNLDRVLSRAEELDVMLLVDEGDSLLTQRTNVQSSNDRYANLETNYLLQRLECFEGILIVTTNAGDRIDAAFERRMDVVVEFQQPQAPERWEIWQMHLPSPNAVDPDFLNDVATRCALGGGQIRNAVLHASLLALDARGVVDTAMIDAAVRREYRKVGAVCPLRAQAYALTGA